MRPGTRFERLNWKQREAEVFANHDIAAQYIASLEMKFNGAWRPSGWNVEVVRSKATDRITLRYVSDDGAVVYGKAYFDRLLGRETYDSLAYLWKNGFAAGSGLEIPEPLIFVEEANMLLMRRAAGTPLSDLAAAAPLDEVLPAIRAAARWLVKFHAADIHGLPIQSPCEGMEILDIADALAKVAAECPGCASFFIGMLHDLHTVAPRSNISVRPTPVHGQFRPAHVFIESNRATVIDIEKVCLSDPAKDVARFVHALKKNCFEEGGDEQRAEQLAGEFVAEYRRLADSNLENLDYFRALLAFKALAKLLKSRKVNEEKRQAIGELYIAEFETATRARSVQTTAA